MQPWVLTLAQDTTTAEPESKSVLEYIAAGGPLSYVLVLVSLAAVALVIRNLIIFSRRRMAPPAVFERLSSLLRDNDIEGALAYCSAPENSSFLTRVFGSALLRCSRS